MDKKLIHTGLYSKRAKLMLSDILDFVSSEWDEGTVKAQAEVLLVKQAPDGEVVLEEVSEPWSAGLNRPFSRPNAQAIKWLCFVIKKFIVEYAYPSNDDKYEAKDVKWEKADIEIDKMQGETVTSIMVLHAVLKGKKNFRGKVEDFLAKSLIGKPNDPVTEGMIIAREDEIASLKRALEDKKVQIRKDIQAKREELYRQMNDLDRESSNLMAAAEDDYSKACEDVKARYAELIKPVSAAA